MYLELLTTATAIQQDLAMAYAQTDRPAPLGQYFQAVNMATTLYFEQIEPPAECRDVHETFLNWQRLGQAALNEELEAGEPVASDTALQFYEAGKQFTMAMIALSNKVNSAK